tara:strand:- start:277 stop:489 length:213 start_codon:yes stop_codon:yes gene_type:complete
MLIDPKKDAELILQRLKPEQDSSVSDQKQLALDSAMRSAFDAARGDDYRKFGSAIIDLLDIHSAGGALDS